MAVLSREAPNYDPTQRERFLYAVEEYLHYLREAIEYNDASRIQQRLQALEKRLALLEKGGNTNG